MISTPALSPAIRLPAPDPDVSPFTGYTRGHWLRLAEVIISGMMDYRDADTGMPTLPGASEHAAVEITELLQSRKEALERTWIAVIFYTYATGRDSLPGRTESLSAPFLRAVTRGTDPDDDAYWGDPQENDQVGSILALAALLHPSLFWDPLGARAQQRLLAYLGKQVRVPCYNNNHHYFHMLPVPLLEQHGKDAHREHLTRMYERLMGWYRGEGWFLDGSNGGLDNYNPWGFQLYNQALYRFDAGWREQFGASIRATTGHFLRGLPWMHDRRGAPIPLGRSLTYRFGAMAAVGWAVANDLCPLSPGQARRLASGTLKSFWEKGCVGANGLLNLGYYGDNSVVGENYTSPGSAYWACQAFSCLLVPESHPFWTAREEPIPADGVGGRRAVPGAQCSIRVSPVDGECRLYPAGQPFTHPRTYWEIGSKYDQHAYSSQIGFCLLGEGAPDIGQGRTGCSQDGVTWFYRQRARALRIDDSHLVSAYYLDLPEVAHLPVLSRPEMFTHTLVGLEGEVHVVWHTHPEPLWLHLGGYGIQVSPAVDPFVHLLPEKLVIEGDATLSSLEVLQAPEGHLEAVVLSPRPGWPSSHLFGGRGAFPQWRSRAPVRPREPLAFFVHAVAGRRPLSSRATVTREGPSIVVELEGQSHAIRLGDPVA